MTNKILVVLVVAVVVGIVEYSTTRPTRVPPPVSTVEVEETPISPQSTQNSIAALPETLTLTGTYVCLPTLSGAATADCAFGIKTDAGEYYAVNFGAGAGSMADFKDGARITAKGTLIPREKLTPDNWKKFTMSGLFTVLEKQ